MPKPVVKVYLSYARHYDQWVLSELLTTLNQIQERNNSYKMEIWNVVESIEGIDSHSEIQEKLIQADVILCLITRKYFQSAYIREWERPIIEERSAAHHPVLPIIIQYTPYEKEWLYPYHLPALPMGHLHPMEDSTDLVAQLWTSVDQKLSMRFNSVAQRKRLKARRFREQELRKKKEKAAEVLGLWAIVGLLFWIGVIVAGYFLHSYPSEDQQNKGSLYLDLKRMEQLDYDPNYEPDNTAAEALFDSEQNDEEKENR